MSEASDSTEVPILATFDSAMSSPVQSSALAASHMENGTQTESASGEDRDGSGDDFDALFAKEAYKSLTSVSRPLLKRMCLQFLNDPLFRNHVKRYLDRPKYKPVPKPPFRFMDLPVELRIQIAELALHGRTGLHWEWKSNDPKRRIGVFREITEKSFYDLSGLTRVCRQIRAETKTIIFKVNILYFDEIDDKYSSEDDPYLKASLHAFRFFMANAGQDVRAVSKSVIFPFCGYYVNEMSESLIQFHNMTTTLPHIDFQLRHDCWYFGSIGDPKVNTERFLESARVVQSAIEQSSLPASKRTWRIFPFFFQEDPMRSGSNMKEHISEEDYEMLVGWVEKGM